MNQCDILIIDDDSDDIEILSDVFIKNGIKKIHYEKSAPLALNYLQTFTNKADLPCLIVSDLYLRGMDGGEFLQTIKALPDLQHIPVILLSTQCTARDVEKYRNMGARDFIVKPSSYDDYIKLGASIKKTIEE